MHRSARVLLAAMITLSSVRPCRADPVPGVPTPEAPASEGQKQEEQKPCVPASEVPAPCAAGSGAPVQEGPELSLGDIVRANLERSYVAFPIGITGIEPLIFE